MTDVAKTSSPETGGQGRVEAQLNNDTVLYLSENTDLSLLQAEKLVREHGDDLERLMKIAATMKAEG